MAIFRRSGNPKPSTPPTRGEYRNDDDPVGAPAPPPVSVDPPTNSVAPSISGSTAAGSVLTATPGTWTGSPNVTGVWQVDGTPIANQVNLTFVIRAADVGKAITYKETAVNVGGTATATSNAITAIAAAGSPPTLGEGPNITSNTSTVTVDTVLTGVPGTYGGSTSVQRRWLRNNVIISGQTGSTYTVTTTDIGAAIVYREIVSNADGSITADSGSVVPEQPPVVGNLLQTFTMSAQPSGVAVSRTGSGATYRNSSGTIVEAAANVARYHYNSDGSFAGLYLEKSKTNQANFSKAVGDTSTTGGWSLNGSGVTVTLNAASAPNGQTQATRVQITAGATLRGIQKGFTVTSGTLRNSIYLRSRSGSQDIIIRDPASGYTTVTMTTTWQRFDLIGVNEGGSWFNCNILTPDGNAKDFEVWGLDLCPSGASNDSLLLASGSGSVTRPAEVLSITTAHTGNKDIKVTFSNDSTQNFLNQSLPGGVLVLNAASLTAGQNLIKSIEIWNAGTLTGSTPPAPPPAAGTIGNIVAIGDSLTRGSAGNYFSYLKSLTDALTAGGYSHTFQGPFLTYPSNVPALANGGWTIAEVNDNRLTTLDDYTEANLVIVCIGTNDLGTPNASIATEIVELLDNIEATVPAGCKILVASPPDPGWFDSSTYAAYYQAVWDWTMADTSRRYLTNLDDAGLVSGDFTDGTHWTEAGAGKIATLIYQRMQAIYGSAPSPAPSPTPEPPPAPPPAGGVWTAEETETAIALAIASNEGDIKGVANGTGGWKSGAALAMGNRWNSAPPMPATWDWPTGPWDVNMYWPYIYPWGILFNRSDNNSSEGWIELKDFEMQILYRNASSWTRIIGKTSEFGWGELFLPDNITSTGIAITKRVNASGTTSIKLPNVSNHPHFTCSGAGTQVSNLANIEGVLITCLARIDPNGDQNVKALLQMSADPKPTTGGNAADGVPWYPGCQCSPAMNVTTSWRRLVSCNITGIAADSTQLSRTMSPSRIRAVRPLA